MPYEALREALFSAISTITMIHDGDDGLLLTYFKQNRVNTPKTNVCTKDRYHPSVSKYCFSEEIQPTILTYLY